jgi:carbamoyl-phosphate synthase large subunit
MTKNLFITAIGGDIACATLRCIHDGYSYNKIIGCDITKYVQGIMYVDDFIIAPKYTDLENYISFIKSSCFEYNITHFLPMSEAEIIIANDNRDFFEEHNIKLMINNKLIIDIATSKLKTSNFLRENNVLTPITHQIDEFKNQINFPLILKPDQSCGSKNIHIVSNKSEFEYIRTSTTGLIAQQYIGNSDDEYTIGLFSNRVITKSIIFKRKLGFGGMSTFVETICDDEVSMIAQKVADILELNGSINIQMRKENGKYYIFEINPRISSTVGFRHKLGFKDVIWWLNYLDGEESNIDFTVPIGKVGIKVLDELILDK